MGRRQRHIRPALAQNLRGPGVFRPRATAKIPLFSSRERDVAGQETSAGDAEAQYHFSFTGAANARGRPAYHEIETGVGLERIARQPLVHPLLTTF
jgi:hypothetical protein